MTLKRRSIAWNKKLFVINLYNKKNQTCAVNGPQTSVIVIDLIKWFLYLKKQKIFHKKKEKMHSFCEKNTRRTQLTKQMNLVFNRHKFHAFNARA